MIDLNFFAPKRIKTIKRVERKLRGLPSSK